MTLQQLKRYNNTCNLWDCCQALKRPMQYIGWACLKLGITKNASWDVVIGPEDQRKLVESPWCSHTLEKDFETFIPGKWEVGGLK